MERALRIPHDLIAHGTVAALALMMVLALLLRISHNLWPAIEARELLGLFLSFRHGSFDQFKAAPVCRVHAALRHILVEAALISQVLEEEFCQLWLVLFPKEGGLALSPFLRRRVNRYAAEVDERAEAGHVVGDCLTDQRAVLWNVVERISPIDCVLPCGDD